MKPSSTLVWRLCLIVLLLSLSSEVAIVWLSGKKETADAFDNGRRLLIDLASGEISGRIISSENLEQVIEEIGGKTADNSKDAADTTSATDAGNKNSDEKKETEKKDAEPATSNDSSVNTSASTDDKNSQKQSPDTTQATKTESSSKAPPNQEHEEIVSTITETVDEAADLPPASKSENPPAPFSTALTDKSEFGALPKISRDGKKPWKYYAKPYSHTEKKPMIALIISGVGTNKNINELALRLPEEINISLSPYSNMLHDLANSARSSGHELLIDMPMEPSDYPAHDPGPLALLVSQDQQGNTARITKLMAHDFGYIGFLTPQDEVFVANGELFKSLQSILSGRGLALIVGKQPPKNETRELIEKGNTASLIADTLVDEELTTAAITARLSLLEQTAKQRGYAIGIAGAYPITIKQINEWVKKAEENGIVIVPVSVILSKHFS